MRCLVIGQGLAGSVLAWTLRKRGVDVQVIDAETANQSSRAAAGIVNPITGKRLARSWNFELFCDHARALYQAMEKHWSCQIWHDTLIYRVLPTPKEINDWEVKKAATGYDEFLAGPVTSSPWQSILTEDWPIGLIRHAARVNFSKILNGVKADFSASGRFHGKFNSYEDLKEQVKDFDCVIFCEGYRANQNPYFPKEAWQLAKGEAMLVHIPDLADENVKDILKGNVIIVPLGHGNCWVGSSYEWDFTTDGPSKAVQGQLESKLRALIRAPYTVLERYGAVRPTVRDRRPTIGVSRKYSNVYIFNGLGTKGGLLAPYWADHLADHLLENQAISTEVDIKRFL